ncbi:hypothetical protein ABZ249_04860 [Nocardiopsis sp. NPDC006139]|uniref:hypothetical protein n=1 Tax=unclassified Nocardiopsis TaxID=2649073 RepID=UPI0033A36D09
MGTLFTALMTVAFTVLMGSITTQLRNTLKMAATRRQENYLAALNSPTEKRQIQDRIEDLDRKPEEIAADNRAKLDEQSASTNKLFQMGNEIERVRESHHERIAKLEGKGVARVVFDLTDAGVRMDSASGTIRSAIDDRNRRAESGQDTSQIDLELRAQAAIGLVSERYELRPDAPLSPQGKIRAERYLRELNNLNPVSDDLLRDALEVRPERVARALARHGLTDSVSRSVTTSPQMGTRSRLGPARGVVAALQQNSGASTDPAAIPRLPTSTTTARTTGQGPASGRTATP